MSAIAWLMMACRAVQQQSVPLPSQPVAQQDSVRDNPIQPAASLPIWTSFRTDLTIHVQSSESATSIRDSATHHLQVRVTPVRDTAGSYSTRFSGTVADSSLSMDSTVYILTPRGIISSELPVNCDMMKARFSPIYSRFFIPRHSVTWPVSDTLRYSSCLGKLGTRSTVVYTWQQPALHASTWAQQVQYFGTIAADSNHILPLSIRAQMNGTATLWFDPIHLNIDTARAELQVLVHGLSSVRQEQIIQQTVSLWIKRQ